MDGLSAFNNLEYLIIHLDQYASRRKIEKYVDLFHTLLAHIVGFRIFLANVEPILEKY